MYIVKDGNRDRCDTGRVKTFKVVETKRKPDEMSDEEFAKTGFNHRLEPVTFTWLKDVYVDKEFDIITSLDEIISILKIMNYEAIKVVNSDIEGIDKEIRIFEEVGYMY